jgi:hypothetical protein
MLVGSQDNTLVAGVGPKNKTYSLFSIVSFISIRTCDTLKDIK